VKRRILLIAVGLSSCLLPRVDFDASLGSAGTSAGGGGGAAHSGGTDAGGSASPGGGRTGSAGAPSGQGGKAGAGSGGATGSAGAPSGQGGKSGAGSGGTTYMGGATSSAGASSGTAGRSSGGASGSGAGGTSGGAGAGGCGALAVSQTDAKCCVASAPTTNASSTVAIDDLEDDDNAILPIGNRQGYWFAYSDPRTTQMPAASGGALPPTAGAGHPCSLLPAPPACAGKAGGIAYSAATSGSLAVTSTPAPSYAGLGFDFNNRLMKSCAYSASAYTGISFWAKGNAALRAMIKIPATTSTSTTASIGTCTVNCEDHYGISVPVLDPATWKQFTITFSDRTTFAQAGWGTKVTFDNTALLAMQFQVSGSITATTSTPYSFSIDDVAFISP
jgi:Carbohydrate binding domain (family 11)